MQSVAKRSIDVNIRRNQLVCSDRLCEQICVERDVKKSGFYDVLHEKGRN